MRIWCTTASFPYLGSNVKSLFIDNLCRFRPGLSLAISFLKKKKRVLTDLAVERVRPSLLVLGMIAIC